MDCLPLFFERKDNTNGVNYGLLAEQFAIHTIEYTAHYRPYDIIIIRGDDQYTNSAIDRFSKRLQKNRKKSWRIFSIRKICSMISKHYR